MDAMTKEHLSTDDLRRSIEHRLKYSMGKDPEHASAYDWRVALSLALRDRIVDPWFESTRTTYREQRKRVYYLSMEFLIGRLIQDAVTNLGLEDACRQALADLGQNCDELLADEPDAALGNGGLGRLAASTPRLRSTYKQSCLRRWKKGPSTDTRQPVTWRMIWKGFWTDDLFGLGGYDLTNGSCGGVEGTR